jgi:hypothetical protein
MRDQQKTYKAAGDSAKQLALHLCGKTKLQRRSTTRELSGLSNFILGTAINL